jgi:histidyl-tRNA synthetase
VPPSLHESALIAIDKKDKIGPGGVEGELLSRGVPEAAVALLVDALEGRQVGGVYDPESVKDEILRLTRERIGAHAAGTAALDNLEEIFRLCRGTSAERHVFPATSLARGLSYYTGAIMEIVVPDLAGSLGGGGRYDNLVGVFLGRDVPACGFSLGLERIIVVMTERNMFPATVAGGAVDVMVTIWNEESRADALALAAELRKGGLRVDVYPEADKLGKQFKYASSRNVPCVAIVGDDERAQGLVAIKDMKSGEQTAHLRTDVTGAVARKLKPWPSP